MINTIEMKMILLHVCDRMIEAKEMLCDIDGLIGDGDHGIGIERGFLAARRKIESYDTEDIKGLYQLLYHTLMQEMGGASGIMYSALFMGIDEMPAVTSADTSFWKTLFSLGLANIKRFGHAEIGDKTLVDALEPAVVSMENFQGDADILLFESAYQAAEAGKEKTKQMVAKFGRAKFIQERSLGHEDAGAVSICILLQSIKEGIAQVQNC